jgi:hypothetical protein
MSLDDSFVVAPANLKQPNDEEESVEVEEEAAKHSNELHGRHVCQCEQSPIEDDLAFQFISGSSVNFGNVKFEIILVETEHLKNV